MPVTEHDITKQVRRLMATFNTSKPAEEIVEAWKWVLGDDVDAPELMAAVSEYAKGASRYFPTPGQIREAALRDRAHRPRPVDQAPDDWNQLQDGPCPVCGAVLQLATDPLAERMVWDSRKHAMRPRTKDDPPPPKRYTVVHDAETHRGAGVPAVGQVSYREARGAA